MTLQSLLLAIHLLGCTFGVGASTILDLRILRLLSGRAVSDEDLAFARFLSGFVRLGLLLLWLSGLCFLVRYWLVAPELLGNPKLHAKIAVVLTLTLNGALIEIYVMPFLVRQRDRALFDGLTPRTQIAALVVGTVSATSWYAAFALGLLREWNFTMPGGTIIALYVSALAAGCCVSILARQMFYRPASAPREPEPGATRAISPDALIVGHDHALSSSDCAARAKRRARKPLAAGRQSAPSGTPAEFVAAMRIRKIMHIADFKAAMK